MHASSIEHNKHIARKFLQLVTDNNVEEMCDIITPDWKMYGTLQNLANGPAGIRELCEQMARLEQAWAIDHVIAAHDLVVVRASNTCRQERYFGLPGHRRKQVFTAIFLHKIVDGKIAETHRNGDDLDRIFQSPDNDVVAAKN
jgi:hypothetical protein